MVNQVLEEELKEAHGFNLKTIIKKWIHGYSSSFKDHILNNFNSPSSPAITKY